MDIILQVSMGSNYFTTAADLITDMYDELYEKYDGSQKQKAKSALSRQKKKAYQEFKHRYQVAKGELKKLH